MEIKEFQSQINQIGICQGRLTQPPGNQLQWFPGEKWKNEFYFSSPFLQQVSQQPPRSLQPDAGIRYVSILSQSEQI